MFRGGGPLIAWFKDPRRQHPVDPPGIECGPSRVGGPGHRDEQRVEEGRRGRGGGAGGGRRRRRRGGRRARRTRRRQAAVLRRRRPAPGRGRAVRRRRAPCPASASCCARARGRPDNGLLTQAPPNTGAGWFTLATGAWPGVAGSTNNTFHVNGQPFAQPHDGLRSPACCRPRRSPRRPSAAARRSPRSSGPAAAAARSTGPTLDFRNFRSGRGVATNYIAPADSAAFTAAFGLQFDHPAGLRRPGAVPAGGARRRPRAGPTCRSRSARRRRCACACSTSASTSTASTPTSTTARTTAQTRYDRVLFSPTKDGDDAVGDLARGRVGRRQGHDPGRRPRRQDGRDARQGRAARARPLAGAAVPHVGDARDRDVADVAGRARASPATSRTSSPSASRRRRPATSPSSRPASSARRPTSSRACTGRPVPPADQVRARHVPARPGAGRLSGHRRVPAPVPRARHPRAAQRRPPTRPTTTSRSTARPTAASSEREGVHPPRLPGRRRHDAPRPAAAARPRR